MLRFFKFVGFAILGFLYLIFLAANPQAALTWSAIFIVLYLIDRKQIAAKQRKQAMILAQKQEKEAAKQRKQAMILAQKQEEEAAERRRQEALVREAAEQRKQAIVLARQRKDLYEYDPSIQESDRRSTKNMWENPALWAEAIDARYGVAKKNVLDAELVLNDDVEQFDRYRRQLQVELIPKYEAAIRPFIEDLQLRDEDIPTPRELKIAIDFVYPSNLLPNVIHQDLASLSQTFGNSLRNVLQGKDIMKLQKGDMTSIAIMAAFAAISYLYTLSTQRTKLEKVQADVDKLCEQISGAIKTYGRASEEIKHLKSVHQVAINYMMRYLDIALELSTQGKTFSDLQAAERKAIETCYRGGQSLKQIMKQDVIKPIENTN